MTTDENTERILALITEMRMDAGVFRTDTVAALTGLGRSISALRDQVTELDDKITRDARELTDRVLGVGDEMRAEFRKVHGGMRYLADRITLVGRAIGPPDVMDQTG